MANFEYQKYNGYTSQSSGLSKYGFQKYGAIKSASTANPLIPNNNPYKSLENYSSRLLASGITPPERQADGEGNFLEGVFKLLNMAGSANTNVINDLVVGAKTPGKQNTIGSLAKSYGQGWSGERQDSTSDVLASLGIERNENPDGKWYNPLSWDIKNTAINVASFAGDVAVDPLSWVSLGSLKLAKNTSKGLTKEAVGTLVKKQTGGISNIAEAMAKQLGMSVDDVVNQARKISKMDDALADTTMRTAYALGKGGTDLADNKLMNYMMQKGLDGVNPDIIGKYADDLIKSQAELVGKGIGGVISPMTQAVKSRSGTLAQKFKGSLSGKEGGINVYEALKNAKNLDEFDAMTGGIEGILKSYDTVSDILRTNGKIDPVAERIGKTKLLQATFNNIPPADLKALASTLDIHEMDIIVSLRNGFGAVDSSIDDLAKQAKSMNKAFGETTGRMVSPDVEKIMGRFATERGVRESITKLDDGIEFANGLQRAYDVANKRFYLRYHNPITNTVKPIIELTSVTQNPTLKRAGEAVLGIPPIRKAQDILGYMFNTEHMGKAYKYARTKNIELDDIARQVKAGTMTKEAGILAKNNIINFFDDIKNTTKTIPELVTKYNRASTSLPPRAVSAAVGMFNSKNPLDIRFLKDDKVQEALTHFRQKDLSDAGTVGWEMMRGRHVDDVLNEMFDTTKIAYLPDEAIDLLITRRDELRELFSQPKVLDYIKKHNIGDDDIELIMRANGKVTSFTEAVKDFDIKKGTVFTETEIRESDMLSQVYLKGADINTITDENYVYSTFKKAEDADSFSLSPMGNSQSVTQRVKNASSATTNTADAKVYATAFDAMINGKEPVTNVVMTMALRNIESQRVALNRSLADDLIKSIKRDPELNHLISINPVNDRSFKKVSVGVQDFYVSPDIQNQLNRIVDTFSTNLGAAEALRYLDQVTNIVKRMQTSMNPGFLMRNVVGESMMCFMDGVKIKSFKQAREIMDSMRAEGFNKVGDTMFHKGEFAYRENSSIVKTYLTPKQKKLQAIDYKEGLKKFMDTVDEAKYPEESAHAYQKRIEKMYNKEKSAPSIKSTGRDYIEANIGGVRADYLNTPGSSAKDAIRERLVKEKGIKTYTFGNETYSVSEIMELFFEEGLAYSGITKGNLIENAGDAIKREMKGQTGNKFLNKVTSIGDDTETLNRLAHFIDKLDSGFGIREAAQQVRLYHVDYKDLTTVERTLFRRVAPYYTYMRKNLPIQVKNLYTNLGRVNMVSELVKNSYDALEVNNGGREIITDDYLAEGMALPIGVNEAGDVQYFNWNLPLNDLGRLTLDFGEFFDTNVLEMLHPVLRASSEIPMNRSLGFDQELEKFEGEQTPLLPGTDTVNIPKKMDYFLRQLGIVESARKGAGTVYNAFTGAPKDVLKPTQVPLLQSLIPIKNQYNTLNNQAYQYRDQLADYIKLLEQKGIKVPTLEELRQQQQYSPTTSRYTP